MAKRKQNRQSRLRFTVAVLVLAVAALCLYASYSDKTGVDPLRGLSLKLPDFVERFLDDIGGYAEGTDKGPRVGTPPKSFWRSIFSVWGRRRASSSKPPTQTSSLTRERTTRAAMSSAI